MTKYFTMEERKAAYTRIKSKYMAYKEWYCPVCLNGHDYKLSNKACHKRTKKHQRNLLRNERMVELYNDPPYSN